MTKTVYLVKEKTACELDNTTVSITKWVNSEDLNANTSIEILDKRILSENWVWENEIFTLDEITGEASQITHDHIIS